MSSKSVTFKIQGQIITVLSPFNREFVDELKIQIPAAARSWDGSAKAWLVSTKYLADLTEIVQANFGSDPVVIKDAAPEAPKRDRILIEYMGRCKDPESKGTAYANCMINGFWNLQISEAVLRAYFENPTNADVAEQVTKYGLLGAKPTASEDELKAAFRRAARTWHPDLNHDPDAPEMFKQVKAAYDLLSNPLARSKYDAGLKLQALVQSQQGHVQSWKTVSLSTTSDYGYRAPANCGWMTADIEAGLRRKVTRIHAWEDDIKTIGHIKLVRVARWSMNHSKPGSDGWRVMDPDAKGQLVTTWEEV